MAFLTRNEIEELGFKKVGENILISDKASIYNARNITLGSNVRVDDFCILSAGKSGIEIGNFVHIGAYSSLLGAEKITLEDFVGVSLKVSIFSSSDDFMGYGMSNPTVPDKYKKVKSLPVLLKKHSLVGAHSVLLPGAILGNGVALGTMSVASSELEDWNFYTGHPIKKIVRRSKKLLDKELELIEEFAKVSL
ncbi:acyltransferase [Shewanella aegiceratis]|uniref:acyltransferase n=1 Tax=Shewanella aegiceratis TaxID=2864203 RepID=UPI001C659558|nr:acyltransferase [Shewanella aegiceratis]QYJ83755.1 acyltransferase [Shewanella aegiceratis]